VLNSAADVPEAIKQTLAGLAEARLTPSEANAIIAGLKAYSDAEVNAGHEQRLRAIEDCLNGEAASRGWTDGTSVGLS
jgi:hypothetical protein